MLKIYEATVNEGKIQLNDYIKFKNGYYDTGLNGFGLVRSGNNSVDIANYEHQELESYLKYLKSIKQIDGYVEDYVMLNPTNYQELAEKFSDVKEDYNEYRKFDLYESGVLLFTNYVKLKYRDDGSIKRIFGRYPENGMYVLAPDALFEMSYGNTQDEYEVLQSDRLGKRLSLAKIERKYKRSYYE